MINLSKPVYKSEVGATFGFAGHIQEKLNIPVPSIILVGHFIGIGGPDVPQTCFGHYFYVYN